MGCITTRRQRGHYARPFFQAQKFLGMPRLECPRPITTLTNNYNTLRKEINALNAQRQHHDRARRPVGPDSA
jgi:hypothetical protein